MYNLYQQDGDLTIIIRKDMTMIWYTTEGARHQSVSIFCLHGDTAWKKEAGIQILTSRNWSFILQGSWWGYRLPFRRRLLFQNHRNYRLRRWGNNIRVTIVSLATKYHLHLVSYLNFSSDIEFNKFLFFNLIETKLVKLLLGKLNSGDQNFTDLFNRKYS